MLQDQTVNLTFQTGVDTKTNDKLAVKLSELENGVFEEKLTIRKRAGYDELSTNILGGGTIDNASAVFSFESELLKYSNPNVYSYNETNDNWVLKGTAYSFNASSNQVIRNSYQQSQVDHAINGNIKITAWKDSRGTVRYTVTDFLTGLAILNDQSIASSVDSPKFAIAGDYIFLFYCEASAIKCISWNVQTSSAFSSALTVGSDLHADHLYDVSTSGANLVVAYKNTTPAIAVKYVRQDMTLGSTTNGLVNPVFLTNTVTSTICTNVNQETKEIAIFWHNSASGMQYRVLNFDFTNKLTTTVWDSSLTATASKRVTCVEITNGSYELYYEVDAAQTYNRYIKKQTANNVGTVGTASILKRSIGLASKAFLVNGNWYFLAVHDSTLQATYFLLKTNGDITNKFSYSLAGGIIENNMLSGVAVVGTDAYLCTQIKNKLISDNGTNFFLKGVQFTKIEFDAMSNFYRETLGKNLHITGGYLSIYDGQSVVEHGFHLFPENISSAALTSGGSMADGTYLYYVCYEWIDGRGQIHRSSPSIASTVTISGGGGAGRGQLTIPTLRLTSKVSPRTNVNIGVYRTKAGQTVAYRVSSISSFTFNDTSVDTITYTDSLNDSSIGSNDLLYTTGGVLPNGSSEAATLVKSFKNRLFLGGLENKTQIKYSKEYKDTEGVFFADELTLKVEDEGGPITAFEALDDYFILFKNSRIYALTGNGPNDLGQNNDYNQPTRLPFDVGCSEPNSVVSMSLGIMFKSEKGIYLLTRQLELNYIGADVEAYNSQQIMSADVIPQNNLVLFTCAEGLALGYDYTVNQWTTWTNHNGFDATIWKNEFTYLRTNGQVFRRNATKYKDGEQKYSLKIVTSWIKLNGIQNFQRIKRAIVLGDYYSQHIMRMSVAYDYNDYFFNSYRFNPDQIIETSVYGDSDSYGSDAVYGGVSDGVYQFEAHLKVQKCQAIKFKFEDLFNGTNGQAYSLSDLGLLVGVKKGLNKLKAAKKV